MIGASEFILRPIKKSVKTSIRKIDGKCMIRLISFSPML